MTFNPFATRLGALAAAGAVILGASLPAFATHPASIKPDAAQQKFEVKRDGKGTVKYCATLPPITGSIMPVHKCQTAEQWHADGVEINVNGG